MTNLFKPKTPAPKPVAPIPDENDPAILAAERKRRSGMMSKGGRQSTILSGGGGSNLSQEYTSQTMG